MALIRRGEFVGRRLRVLKSLSGICKQIQVRFLKPESLKREPRPHPETPKFPNQYKPDGPTRGRIYDKKPFKLSLEADKWYFWCSCGHSKTQPLCDGWHKKLAGTAFKKTMPKYSPIKFQVKETKDYWLCNCKQTNKRPFCDGTHKREDIQAAVK